MKIKELSMGKEKSPRWFSGIDSQGRSINIFVEETKISYIISTIVFKKKKEKRNE